MNTFFRYPHTPHFLWLSESGPRDDKVLNRFERLNLLDGAVCIEEKVDGANLGFSIGIDGNLRAQNRGQYLLPPYGGQFVRLGEWLDTHQDALFDVLTVGTIAFGEWCGARHSLEYDRLPDWWLMFDIYDRDAQRFFSSTSRNEVARSCGLSAVASIHQGHIQEGELLRTVLEGSSSYRTGAMEGVILRKEEGAWLVDRAKLVRPDFHQTIEEHWRHRPIVWNHLLDKL